VNLKSHLHNEGAKTNVAIISGGADDDDRRRPAAATGIAATGSVGTDKPLESMTDALAAFAATHVLLAVPPNEESYWLERDLLEKARALTELTVTQVVVPSAMPAAYDGLEQAVAGVTYQTDERSEEKWHP
jgi:hypothetical protein